MILDPIGAHYSYAKDGSPRGGAPGQIAGFVKMRSSTPPSAKCQERRPIQRPCIRAAGRATRPAGFACDGANGPREGAVLALRFVDHRDVRRNLLIVDELVEVRP